MNKLLSIIIPSYNMEKYLPKCLASVCDAGEQKVGQESRSREDVLSLLDIIVVNDGSTDRTSEIAHNFEHRYPGVVRVIDKLNGHYGSCINAGLKVAAGEYIKILDADDWFDGEALKKFITGLEQLSRETHPDLVLSDFVWVDEDGKPFRNTTYGDGAHSWTKTFRDFDKAFFDGIFMHGVTYRTQMLREMGYRQTEGVSYTDNQWAKIPLMAVWKISYVPCTLYQYLVGRAGQSIDPAVYNRSYYRAAGKWALESLEFILRSRGKFDQISYDYVDGFVKESLAGVYSTAIYCFHNSESDEFLRDLDQKILERSHEVYVDISTIPRWSALKIRPIQLWRKQKDSRHLLLRLFLTVCAVRDRMKRK